jgi:hypothetical protein
MPDEEESGFRVIDKRRVGRESGAPEGGEASAGTTQAAPGEAPTTVIPDGGDDAEAGSSSADFTDQDLEADDEEVDADARPTSAVDLAQMCLGMMNEVAWVKMGLVPDPMTGALGADLAQARLAIDCAGDLVHRLEAYVEPKTYRDLEVLIQNLKMNFVRKSTGA